MRILLASVVIVISQFSSPALAAHGDCEKAELNMNTNVRSMFQELSAKGFKQFDLSLVMDRMIEHHQKSAMKQIEYIESRPGDQTEACDDFFNRLFNMYYHQTYRYFNLE